MAEINDDFSQNNSGSLKKWKMIYSPVDRCIIAWHVALFYEGGFILCVNVVFFYVIQNHLKEFAANFPQQTPT